MKLFKIVAISLLLMSCSKQHHKEAGFTIESASWEELNSGHTGSTRGMSVVDENLAWLSSSRGIYAITEDAGKTWLVDSLVPEDSLQFRDIEAFSRDVAYMMSIGSGETSRIYKTVDGGKNWTMQIKNEHPEGFYDGFAFWDENNAILIGDPVDGKHFVMKMTDGKTWTQIDPDKIAALAEGEIGGFAASGTTIAVYGDNVWFGTGGKVARVHHSPDRGESWNVYDTPMMAGAGSTGIFSLDFRDEMHGVMVGGDYTKPDQAGYTVATTSDGGKTWQALSDTSIVSYRSCVQYIPHSMSLVAVGRGGTSSFSNDDGKTWTNFGDIELYTMSFARHSSMALGAGPNGKLARLWFNESVDAANQVWLEQYNKSDNFPAEIYIGNPIVVSASGKVFSANNEIDNYFKEMKSEIGQISDLMNLGQAEAHDDISYAINQFSDANQQLYKQLVIWKNERGEKHRELEINVKSVGEADLSDLDTAREKWMQLCNSHQSEELVKQMYSANAVYYNHEPPLVGTESISKEYQYMNNPKYSLKLIPMYVESVAKGLVFEIGRCEGSYTGKYMLVWQRGDQGWQVLFDSNV